MALFHSHVQIISRSKGKSAVSAAAYRAAELLKSERERSEYDFTRKRGVVHTEILLPDHAPREYSNRAVLWNAVETIEKAENAQLARELDIALPVELSREQGIALARDYAKYTFVSAGMCADLCVHDKGDGNPHFHVMLTMRPINDDGTWGGKQRKEYILDNNGNKIYDPKKRQYKCRSIKSTDWNDRSKADEWRKIWEDMANEALKSVGSDSRIDRRSYADQGIEQIPTVHMGPVATQLEKQGIRTELGDRNREIIAMNQQMRQLRARLRKVNDWLIQESVIDRPPTLVDVFDEIMTRRGQSALTRIRNGSEILSFLTRNGIRSESVV